MKTPKPALLRSASLTDFAEVARTAGLNPRTMLAEAGLPMDVLDTPDLKVPADAVRQLLELCAQRSGDQAFGLRLALARRLSNLGMMGLLVREEPTLRRALDAVVRYGHLHNEALFLKVEEAGGIVVIREELIVGKGGPLRQSTELAIAVLYRFLTVFLGPQWRPRRVCFAHAAPRDRSVHLRLFGPHVEFGHDFNGIVFNAGDLDLPNPTADPVIARYARQVLEASAKGGARVTDEVRQLVLVLLPAGHCTIDVVAQHFGVDRRTLHRWLAREGETFSGTVEGLRRELVARYLDESSRPLAEVSALLGFSAPSAFSRWHRMRFNASALQRQRGRLGS
ncbi:MAG TPA: AraC family transcriptional regulator ligand-binding domain-containing protein [Ramlibacter sp.]|nr:AraC family transcriptional regulator ligand-binding domain-containing protein [Ramlibacter sp.]